MDTSVIGGCFDLGIMDDSRELINLVRVGQIKMIRSELLDMELKPARQEIRDICDKIPAGNIIEVVADSRSVSMALRYIRSGALTNKSYYDALHIAMATVNEADILASWNFKHIVNIDKIEKYNIINRNFKYKEIKILSPKAILNQFYENEKRV